MGRKNLLYLLLVPGGIWRINRRSWGGCVYYIYYYFQVETGESIGVAGEVGSIISIITFRWNVVNLDISIAGGVGSVISIIIPWWNLEN